MRGPGGTEPASAGRGASVAEPNDGRRHAFITGIDTVSLFRLLWRNRFRVSRKYLWDLLHIGAISVLSTVFGACEKLVYGRRIERTEITEHPIFIVGHWRSGTTYLHKLLSLDERHTCPTLFQCVFPNCFLGFERQLKDKVAASLPGQRPMDRVRLGVDEPFEDEFALMKMTLISPMLIFVFPGSSRGHEADCDLSTASAQDRERWKRALLRFLKKITLKTGKRIILKSPPHSYRIKMLLSVFPDARFVCMVRDPYMTFASNLRLWESMLHENSLQEGGPGGIREMIFSRYVRMFLALERDKRCIPEGRYCEARFEDLEADPVGTVGRIYEKLDMADFRPFKPELEAFLERNRSYAKNVYELNTEEKEEIYRRWEPAFVAYGYEK